MISNLVTNPALYEFTKTAQAQVGVATSLKAIGRPGFILLDKDIDSQTKKYSAMKEFLYQLTCLAMAMLVVSNFKKHAIAIGRKLFKNEQVFQAFKDYEQFAQYLKLDKAQKILKLDEISKKSDKTNVPFEFDKINENLAKGVKEVSSIVGSMLGLSIAAPAISRPLIRPVLKILGLNKKEPETTENKPKVIVNA